MTKKIFTINRKTKTNAGNSWDLRETLRPEALGDGCQVYINRRTSKSSLEEPSTIFTMEFFLIEGQRRKQSFCCRSECKLPEKKINRWEN